MLRHLGLIGGVWPRNGVASLLVLCWIPLQSCKWLVSQLHALLRPMSSTLCFEQGRMRQSKLSEAKMYLLD